LPTPPFWFATAITRAIIGYIPKNSNEMNALAYPAASTKVKAGVTFHVKLIPGGL
jgi:hypothetical protein